MRHSEQDERYAAFRQAIEEHVCVVCLDRTDTGECSLPHGRTCAIERHLPTVVEVLSNLDSRHLDDYVARIEAEVCARCSDRGPDPDPQHCQPRSRGECALASYLALMVEAVEEARKRQGPVLPPPAER